MTYLKEKKKKKAMLQESKVGNYLIKIISM